MPKKTRRSGGSWWTKAFAAIRVGAKLVAAVYTGGASTPAINALEGKHPPEEQLFGTMGQPASMKARMIQPVGLAVDVPEPPAQDDLIATPITSLNSNVRTWAGLIPATGGDAALRGAAVQRGGGALKTSPAVMLLGLAAIVAVITLTLLIGRR
jgi:hypothetical protein